MSSTIARRGSRRPSSASTTRGSTTRATSTARTSTAKKATARKATARKATAKKSTAKKATARKSTAKKSTARKSTAKKSTARKSTAKKSTARKSTARKSTAKTSTAKTSTSRRSTARKSTARKATAKTTARRRSTHDDVTVSGFSRTPSRRSSTTRARTRAKGRGRWFGLGRTARARNRPTPVTDAGERNAAFLAATVLGLTLFGLVMVLSASSVSSLHVLEESAFFQFKRQLMWVGLGLVAFIVASRIDYRLLQRFAGPMLIIAIGLLIALLIPGVGHNVNGSTRWIVLGPVVVQPAELAKFVFIVFVADLLARRERRMDRPELTVRPVMLVLGLLSGLMILQPKLGTPIILGAVALLMLFVAGARLNSLLAWCATAIVAASVAAYAAPYRRDRILSFINPWEDPQGIGLQSIQSQLGIASGGLFGVGLGASRAKWGFLPFADTDFIFAIVAEEVGLIGASALISGFLLIAWFGFRAALAAPDRFGMLLAAGITSWLLVQAFMNIGMVLGVMPITGEPLPFVSAGGSSLVTTLAAAGFLTNVARRARA